MKNPILSESFSTIIETGKNEIFPLREKLKKLLSERLPDLDYTNMKMIEVLDKLLALNKISDIKNYFIDLYKVNFNGLSLEYNASNKIRNYAFYKADNLSEISIGNKINQIGAYAFADCASLKVLNLVNASNLIEIGDYCFKNAPFNSLSIPEAINQINSNWFDGSSLLYLSLLGIDFKELVNPSETIGSLNNIPGKSAIYVRKQAFLDYILDLNWNQYKKNIIGYIDSSEVSEILPLDPIIGGKKVFWYENQNDALHARNEIIEMTETNKNYYFRTAEDAVALYGTFTTTINNQTIVLTIPSDTILNNTENSKIHLKVIGNNEIIFDETLTVLEPSFENNGFSFKVKTIYELQETEIKIDSLNTLDNYKYSYSIVSPEISGIVKQISLEDTL